MRIVDGVHTIVIARNSLSAASVALFGSLTLLLPLTKQVEAGYGNGFYPVHQVRQYSWRPVPQAPRTTSGYRWRPVEPVTRVQQYGRYQHLPQPHGRWVRSARPLKRGGELASQFRPDHRFDEPVQQPEIVLDMDSDQHAQFRPIKPAAPRRTYEELYERQEPVATQPRAPAMPYATMPYPVMPYLPPPMPMAPYWQY